MKFYVSRSQVFLFFVYLSSSSDRVEKSDVRQWGRWVWIQVYFKTKWPVGKHNTGTSTKEVWPRGNFYLKVVSLSCENLLTVGMFFFFFYIKLGRNMTYLNQEMDQLQCCWSDKHVTPLMASDMEHNALWHPTRHRLGGYRIGVGRGVGTRGPSPTTEPSIMPPSYAISFALRPISTWEQCKLFKTRFSGLAIIIMMISISVAIASDYLAGNFAAWGRGSSREPTCIVRSEGVERERKR